MKKNFKLLALLSVFALVACGKNDTSTPANQSTDKTSQESVSSQEVSSSQDKESSKEQSSSEKEQVKDLSLTSLFEDSGDEVYTVSTQGTGISVTFAKKAGAEWANLVANVGAADVSAFKSLRFKISGDCKVLVKIESSGGGKEINLRLTGEPQTYEWGFTADDAAVLAGENLKVLVFALPGAPNGEGTFTLADVALCTDFDDNAFPIVSGYTNIIATANEYDGTSATFDINHFWMENDANSYEFVENGDGTVVVNYTQSSSWQFAYTSLQGTGYDKFEYITLKLQGEAGTPILFKVEPTGFAAKETWVTLTGEEDVFTFDLSTYSADERAAISRLLMFAEGGAAEVKKGSFTIKAAYYTDVKEQPDPVIESVEIPAGRFLDLAPAKFAGLDEGVYTAEGNKVSWNKGEGAEWSCAVNALEGTLGDFTRLEYNLTLGEGDTVMLKLEGTDFAAIEHTITASGADYLDLTGKDLSKVQRVVLFGDPGQANETGEVTFSQLRFAAREAAEVDAEGMANLAGSSLFDLGDKVYKVYKEEGIFRVETLEGKGDWSCFGIRVDVPEQTFNHALITVSGDAADALLCKAENDAGGLTVEKRIDALGEHVTCDLDLTNPLANNPDTLIFVFFANPGTRNVAKDIKVESIKLYDANAVETPATPVQAKDARYTDVALDSFRGLDKGVYTVAGNKLSWEKGANMDWSCALANIEGTLPDFTRLEYNITLGEGDAVLLKFEGDGFTPIEHRVETSGKGYWDFTGTDISKVQKLVIFGDPGSSNVDGFAQFSMLRFAGRQAASVANDGTVNLSSGTLFDLGDGVYTITKVEEEFKVVAAQGKGDWACFGLRVPVGETTYTKATITVSGDSADSLLCKVENDDGGATYEKKIEALGEHVTCELELANPLANNPEYLLFVFFANPGTPNASGEIVIESIVLHN